MTATAEKLSVTLKGFSGIDSWLVLKGETYAELQELLAGAVGRDVVAPHFAAGDFIGGVKAAQDFYQARFKLGELAGAAAVGAPAAPAANPWADAAPVPGTPPWETAAPAAAAPAAQQWGAAPGAPAPAGGVTPVEGMPAWVEGQPGPNPLGPSGYYKRYKTGTSAKGPWRAWMSGAPKDSPGQALDGKPDWIK